MPHSRIALFMALVPLLGATLFVRVVALQVVEHDQHAQRAERIRMKTTLVPGRRAAIVDRQGMVLAREVPSWELRLNYWLFTEPENVQRRLAYRGGVPGFSPDEVERLRQYVDALAEAKGERGVSRQRRFLLTWPGRSAVDVLPAPYNAWKVDAQNALARRLRLSVPAVKEGSALLRREVDATLAQLARLVDLSVEELRWRFDLVERAVDVRLHAAYADQGRMATAYAEVVRIGGSAGYWADRAREERRSGIPQEHWIAQTNPLVVATDLERQRIETIVELDQVFFGVSTVAGTRRVYPERDLACHVLGYLRQVDRVGFSLPDGEDDDGRPALDRSPHFQRLARKAADDVGEPFILRHFRSEEAFRQRFRYDIMSHPVGVVGLERAYNDRLSGRFGASIVERDVRARSQRMLDEVPPAAADNLRLTIDGELQRVAQDALDRAYQRWGTPGAAVLMDARTGELLVLASGPSYDLSRLAAGRRDDAAYVQWLLDDAADHGKPLINRAVHSSVPPGSVMKVLSGIAAAEQRVVSGPDFRSDETITGRWSRVLEIPSLRNSFSCHVSLGRTIGLAEALERSSNEYFYEVGHLTGYDALSLWARRFGFGEPTGVDLDHEGRGWRPTSRPARFEASLTAIGQGTMQSTPLQMARFLAAVATRGQLPTPHVASGERPTPVRTVDVAPAVWNVVHDGMRRVVHGAAGTARDPLLRRLRVAAKTGTAETGRTRAGETLHHAWFGGFAPYDDPQVVVVVFIEDTLGYGGSHAGPLAARILQAYADHPEFGERFRASRSR